MEYRISDCQQYGKTIAATTESFAALFKKIIKERKLSRSRFCSLTGLDEVYYSRLAKPERHYALRTIVSVCVGLDLDVKTSERLLRRAGHCLDVENPVHAAYLYLIESCKGVDMETCNQILKGNGVGKIDLLGSKSYKK